MADDGDLNLEIPYELVGGVYANAFNVWSTGHEFTLDFAVLRVLDVAQVVSRVRIPPTLVFDVLRMINAEMTRFEQAHGEIRRVGE